MGIVLVQEDDFLFENVIYYFTLGLVNVELRYSHVEKLVLATIHVVQRLRYYIFFRKNTTVAEINYFHYVLTHHIIGGKYNK